MIFVSRAIQLLSEIMLLCKIITTKLFVGSILLGTGMAKPLENEEYRQYQRNTGGNSYTPPLLSNGAFGTAQNGFSSMGGNPGIFLPQSLPGSSLNSFGSGPFGSAQSFGGSSNPYGTSGGYPAGLPNFFG